MNLGLQLQIQPGLERGGRDGVKKRSSGKRGFVDSTTIRALSPVNIDDADSAQAVCKIDVLRTTMAHAPPTFNDFCYNDRRLLHYSDLFALCTPCYIHARHHRALPAILTKAALNSRRKTHTSPPPLLVSLEFKCDSRGLINGGGIVGLLAGTNAAHQLLPQRSTHRLTCILPTPSV